MSRAGGVSEQTCVERHGCYALGYVLVECGGGGQRCVLQWSCDTLLASRTPSFTRYVL